MTLLLAPLKKRASAQVGMNENSVLIPQPDDKSLMGNAGPQEIYNLIHNNTVLFNI